MLYCCLALSFWPWGVQNMSKRSGDYSTSSNEKKKANKSHGNSDLDDSSHVACVSTLQGEVMQKLSQSVVSLSFVGKGNQERCYCTGLVILSNSLVTFILTSASGIRSSKDGKGFNLGVSIEVNLPHGEVAYAGLRDIDYERNIATVCIAPFPNFREAYLGQPLEVGSNDNVAAICCCKTGNIIPIIGVVTEKSSELYGQKVIMSTCKIPQFGIGGPLINFDGNFIGMNMSPMDNEGTLFLPKETILESFAIFTIPTIRIYQGSDIQIDRSTSEICKSSTTVLNSEGITKFRRNYRRDSDTETSQSESDTEPSQGTSELLEPPDLPDNEFVNVFTKDLLSRGYPLPKMLDGGMKLCKNFEEEFARDSWNLLSTKVALDTSLSVVSLASFNGATRFFACSGVLIGRHKSITRILTSASLVRVANKNEIDVNLKIEVLLPNSKRVIGKLQYHNLNYNTAIVSIRDFHCRRIAHIEKPVLSPRMVVAIGRTFETGKLMATSGKLSVDLSGYPLSDEYRSECGISCCKITKAGIGGPLIDVDGNFIGMNFYGAKATPFLPRHIILELLKDFDRKGSDAAKVNDNGDIERWYVPKPHWYYPSDAPRVHWERRRKH